MGCPYKALADDTRREILKLLSSKSLSASEISEEFNISKLAISYHLKILLKAGLVKQEKRKQTRNYSLNARKIKEILSFINHIIN